LELPYSALPCAHWEAGHQDAQLSTDEWYDDEARHAAAEAQESEQRLDHDEAEVRGDFDRLRAEAWARTGTYIPHDQRPPTDNESCADSMAKMKERNRKREPGS
jgi:hypothetical protein